MRQISTTWGLAALALAALAAAAPAPAPAPALDQLDALTADLDEDKRAWSNLHGGWGKRGWQDMNSAWGKRAWNNLHGGWGKRGWQDMNSAWGKRAWNNLHGGWGKRAWSNLHGGWGKRDASDILELLEASNAQPSDRDIMESNSLDQYGPVRQMLSNNAERILNEAEADQDMDKRTWSSLHGTWGKRSGENTFKALPSKREPGWNNLKGLWGKRSDAVDDSQNDFMDRRDE